MPQKLTVAHLYESLKGLSIQDITMEMTALIHSGAIPVGSRLPPVRQLAEALGMSPSSISSVWHTLKRNNLVSGTGRTGVWVTGNDPTPRPERFESVGNFGNRVKVDLTYAGPDVALLPPLSAALQASYNDPSVHSYRREQITPALRDAVKPEWPYTAQAWMATNGGFDALQVTIGALIQPGSWVAVEEPTTARLLDIIEHLGGRVIPIPWDAEGPDPQALQNACERKIAAFIFQPRSHSVCGYSMSQARFNHLLPIVKNIPLIIEDDGIGLVSNRPLYSYGQHFPDKVVHIRSYSKALGPDMRLAVLSTSSEQADKIQAFRNFGASWSSRILQNAAAYMLRDPDCLACIDKARGVYQQRYEGLKEALAQRSIESCGDSSLSLWIPVPSEQFALVTLAVHGYAVFHGARFMSNPQKPHIRVATGGLQPEQIEPLADAIALCFKTQI